MSLQHQTKRVKISTILRRKSVVEGFNSVRANRPFDYKSCDSDPVYGWGYERGRLLALSYDGPLKNGRHVTDEAIAAFQKGRSEGIII